MATMQGITGGLSGKMGSAVFRQRGGQTIATQYQPIVKNPNTEGQQAQRARFKLMSQLAAIMAPGFGTMSVTKRASKGKPSQRNAFQQLNFPLVEVDESQDNAVTAKIPMEQLKLTSSFRPLGRLSLSTSTASLDVDIDKIPADVAMVRILLLRYPSFAEGTQVQLAEIVDVPVVDNAANYTFNGLSVSGEKVTVLSYGLIPSESTKESIALDNIHTPADEDFISAVELNAMVANGEMIETVTVGANIIAGTAGA